MIIFRKLAAAIMLAAGIAATASLPASASPSQVMTARGCNVVTFPWQPKIGACVDILGVGTHVGHIKGGVIVRRGTSTSGYFHIYDTDPRARLNFRTNEVIHCPPQGRKSPRVCWEAHWHNVNMNLPLRSQVCVVFVAITGKGHQTTQFGPACKTIS